jgi:hypothetical protein
MKRLMLIVTLSVINLTGCAGVARFYDQQDPCQTRAELGRAPGYQMPATCGASGHRTTIYDNQGRRLGYIK